MRIEVTFFRKFELKIIKQEKLSDKTYKNEKIMWNL